MEEKKKTELISIDTRSTTYQMVVDPYGFLLHLYYGRKVDCDMSYLLTYKDRGFSGNPYEAADDRGYSLDALPQEYPVFGCGDFRSFALNLADSQGICGCDLRYRSHRFLDGKYAIPGLPAVYDGGSDSQTVEILLEDHRTGLEVTLRYGVLFDEDVITRSVILRNGGSQTLTVQKAASACLDFVYGSWELLHFQGRHGMERVLERTPVIFGKQSFSSLRGASSHQHNPFVILAAPDTTEDYGDCYGMHLLYSGNFETSLEKDQYSQVRWVLGVSSEMFAYELSPGETFYTPEAALSYSQKGLSELSQNFHHLIRHHICREPWKITPRPVLINNWEATYFQFTGEKILSIAREAAQLGVEMLVLDDGWFGTRNNDRSGLGDWVVNEEKLGMSLGEISAQIHDLGMKFGLWIEPEMANENSDCFRNHPDWVFAIPGRKPVMARNQVVLDFSRQEVVEGVAEQISQVIRQANVDYIKMDMNRSICDVYTAAQGKQNYGTILYRYVLGVYDFLERLHKSFPQMLIEGCAGGGGRFDAGMLYYTPQIWCSDNTDAIERISIQHGTSFGYPVSSMGSHVSAAPNHQTGRTVSLSTRGVVAMAGSFGYELDLNLLSPQEQEEVREQIVEYKKYWNLIHNGRYYRVTDPAKDPLAAWCFTSEDGKECLLSIVALEKHFNDKITYIPCRGLLPEGLYQLENGEQVFDGAALMGVGIPIIAELGEYQSWKYHFMIME